jgi:glycosyltransferase involved in cell wall biosynthesis
MNNALLLGWLRMSAARTTDRRATRAKLDLPPMLPSGRPWPRISIVTPTYNQGKYLEESILSVADQNYPNVEHLVIDGGSDDETPSILQRHAPRLAYWESQPDRGQGHALNKGFARATGEILTWLNSDDCLAPGALASVALAYELTGADMFAGICELFGDGGTFVSHLTSCASAPLSLEDFLDEEFMREGWSFYQPEVMFTRKLWERAGGYVDDELYIVMDYDLWLRFAIAGARLQVIGRPIARLRFHDQQKTSRIANDAAVAARYAAEATAVRARYAGKSSHQSHFPHRLLGQQRKNRLVVQSADDDCFSSETRVAHRRAMETLAYAGHDVAISTLTDLASQTECADARPSMMDAAGAALAPDLLLMNDTQRLALTRSRGATILRAGLHSTELVVTNPTPVDAEPTALAVPAGIPTHQFRPREKADLRRHFGLSRRHWIIAVTVPSPSHADSAFREIVQLVRALGRSRITLLAINCARDIRIGLPNVVATGPIVAEDQLADWLATADVYLAAASGEIAGRYAVEAALCGVPAVGYRGSAAESMIIDGVSGILVDPSDKDGLTRAVRRLLDDAAYRESMSRWGRIALEARRSYAASYHAIHRAFLETGVLQVWRDQVAIRLVPALSVTFTAASREAVAKAYRPALVNGRLNLALPSFCIGLPVYNKAAVIECRIDRIARYLSNVPTRTAIIAVDDGSEDDSYDVMMKVSRRLPIIVHRHERNVGYGAANRTLFALAAEGGFEYTIVMDADGAQDLLFIANCLPLMCSGVDFIKATRYWLGGRAEGVTRARYLISRLGNLLAQLFMDIPLSDFSNRLRAIRTDKWRQLGTTARGSELIVEEYYYARKRSLTFGEVPCVLTVRKEPGSKSKFSYQWIDYFTRSLAHALFPKERPGWIRYIGKRLSRWVR